MLKTTLLLSVVLSSMVLVTIGKVISDCPDGSSFVNCFVDPCMSASCEAYPQAECHSNYCGGCNADFYLNSVKVDCTQKKPVICSVVSCFVNPCMYAKCPAYPEAKCRMNNCNGCFADFYVGRNKVKC